MTSREGHQAEQAPRIARPRTASELLMLIDALCAEIDDPALRAAARAMRSPPGRDPIDDRHLIAEVRRLLRSSAMSELAACLKVAKSVARHGEKPESIARRLQRKLESPEPEKIFGQNILSGS